MVSLRRMTWWGAGTAIAGVTALIITLVATQGEDGQNSQTAQWKTPPSDWDAPTGQSQDGCDITALPGDYSDTPSGEVLAVSASGEYILGEISGDPVLWRDGKYHMIDTGGKRVDVKDVNSDGVVVGELLDASEGISELTPFMYHDGKLTELDDVHNPVGDTVTDYQLVIHGINDAGDIMGNTQNANDAGDPVNMDGYSWDAGDPDADKTEFDGFVAAMNNTGDFIGTTDDDVWKWDAAGEGEKLPDLDGEREALAAVSPGRAQLREDLLLWGGEKTDISADDDPTETELELANAIDAGGDVYGEDSEGHAAVDRDGEVTQLPGLSGGDGATVSAVSEDGTSAAGTATTGDDGYRHAVVWHCD